MEYLHREGSKIICHDASFLNSNNNSKSTQTEKPASDHNITVHTLMARPKCRTLKHRRRNYVKSSSILNIHLESGNRLKRSSNIYLKSRLLRRCIYMQSVLNQQRNKPETVTNTAVAEESDDWFNMFGQEEQIIVQCQSKYRAEKTPFSVRCSRVTTDPMHLGNVTNNSNGKAGWSSAFRQTAKRSIDMSKNQPHKHQVCEGNVGSNAGRKILESRREQRESRPRPWKTLVPNSANNCLDNDKEASNCVNWSKSRSGSWIKIDNSIQKTSDTPEAKFEPGDVQDNTFTLDVTSENSQSKPILNDDTDALYLRNSKDNSDILTSQLLQTHTISIVCNGQKMTEISKEKSDNGFKKKNHQPSRIPVRIFPVTKDTQTEEIQDPLSCSWKSPCECLSPPCEEENIFPRYVDVTENNVDQTGSLIWHDTNETATPRAFAKNLRIGQGASMLKSKQEIAKKVKAMVDSYANFLEREGVMKGTLTKNRNTGRGDNNQRNRETDISFEKSRNSYHLCQNKFAEKSGKPTRMSMDRSNQNNPLVINSFPRACVRLSSSQFSDTMDSKRYAQKTLSSSGRRIADPRLSHARESQTPTSPTRNQITHKSNVANLHYTHPIKTQPFLAQTHKRKKSKYKESIEQEVSVSAGREKPITCQKQNSSAYGLSQLREGQETVKIQTKDKRYGVAEVNREMIIQEIKPKKEGKNDQNIEPKLFSEADDLRIRMKKIQNFCKNRNEKGKTRPYLRTGETTAKSLSGNIIFNTSFSSPKRNDDQQTVTQTYSKHSQMITKVKVPPLTKSLGFDGRMKVEKYGPQTNAPLTSKHGVKGAHAKIRAFSSEQGFIKRHICDKEEDHRVPYAVSLKKGIFHKNVLGKGNQQHDSNFDSVPRFSTNTASLCSANGTLAIETNENKSRQQSMSEIDSRAYAKYILEPLPNSSEKWLENNSPPSKSTETPLTSSSVEQSSLQKFRKTDITKETYESNRSVIKKTSNSSETITSSWQSAEPSSYIDKIPCESSLSKSTRGTIFSNAWLQDDKGSVATSSGERRHSSPALTAGCVESSKSTMKGISDLTYTSVESLPRDYNNAANKQSDLESITVMSDSALMYLKANDNVSYNEMNKDYLIRRSHSDFCYKLDPVQNPKGDLPQHESTTDASNKLLSLHSINYQGLDRRLSNRVTRNTALLRSDKTADKRVRFQKYTVKHLNKMKYGLENSRAKVFFCGNARDFGKKHSFSHCFQPPTKQINTSSTLPNKISASSCRPPYKTKSENDFQDAYFSMTSSATQKKSTGSISLTQSSSPRSNTDFQELLNFWEDKVTLKKIQAAHCDILEITREDDENIGKLDKDTGIKGRDNCTFTEQFQMQELVDQDSESSHYYSRKRSSYSDRNSSASPCKFYGFPLTRKDFTPQETMRSGHVSLSSLRQSDVSSSSSDIIKKRQVKNEHSRKREDRKLIPNTKNIISVGQAMKYGGDKSKLVKAKRRIQSKSSWTASGTIQAFITGTVQPTCSYNSIMTRVCKKDAQFERKKVEQNISTVDNETISIAKHSPKRQKSSNIKNQNGYIERSDIHNIPERMKTKNNVSKIKGQTFNSVSYIRQSVSESSVCLEIVASGCLGPMTGTKYKECCASQSELHETHLFSHSECSLIDMVTAVNNCQEPDTFQNSDADTERPGVHIQILDSRDGCHTIGDVAKNPSIRLDSSILISTSVVSNGKSSGGNFISTEVCNGNSHLQLADCESKTFAKEDAHSSKSPVMFANQTYMRKPQGLNKNNKIENETCAKNRQRPLLCLGESPSNETKISTQLTSQYPDKAAFQNKTSTGQLMCITDAPRHCFESTDVTSKSSFDTGLETTDRNKIAHQIVKLNETSSKIGSITLSTTPHHSAKSEYSTKLIRTNSNPPYKLTQQANKSTKHDAFKNTTNPSCPQKNAKNKKKEITVANPEIAKDHKDPKATNVRTEKQLTNMDIVSTPGQIFFPKEIIISGDSKQVLNQSQSTMGHSAQTKSLNTLKESRDHIDFHVQSKLACTTDESNKNQAKLCTYSSATNNTKLNEFLRLRQNANTSPLLIPSEVNASVPEMEIHNASQDIVTHQGRAKPLVNPEILSNKSKLTQNTACFHIPQVTFLNENQKQNESDEFKNVHEVEIVIGKDIPVQRFVDCFINGLTGNTKGSKTQTENKDVKPCKSVRPPEKKTQTQLNTSASNKAGCEPNSKQTLAIHSSNDDAGFVHRMQVPLIDIYRRKNNIVRSQRRSTAQRIKKQLRDHPVQSPDSEDSEKTHNEALERGNYNIHASSDRKSKSKWEDEERKTCQRLIQNSDKTKLQHYHERIPDTIKSHANGKRVCRSFLRHNYRGGGDIKRHKTSPGPLDIQAQQDQLHSRQQENELKSLNDDITDSKKSRKPAVDPEYFNQRREEISLEKQRDKAIQNIQVFAPCCFPTTGKSVQVLVTKEPDYKRVQLTMTDNRTNKQCQVSVEPKNKQDSLSPQVETKFGFVHVNFYPRSHNETDNNYDHGDRTGHKFQSHDRSKDLSIQQSRLRASEYLDVSNEENYFLRQSHPYKNMTNSHLIPMESGKTWENRTPNNMPTFHSTVFTDNPKRGCVPSRYSKPLRIERNRIPAGSIRKGSFLKSFIGDSGSQRNIQTALNIDRSYRTLPTVSQRSSNSFSNSRKDSVRFPTYRSEFIPRIPYSETQAATVCHSRETDKSNKLSPSTAEKSSKLCPFTSDKGTGITPRLSDKCIGMSPHRQEKFTYASPCRPEKCRRNPSYRSEKYTKVFPYESRKSSRVSSSRSCKCTETIPSLSYSQTSPCRLHKSTDASLHRTRNVAEISRRTSKSSGVSTRKPIEYTNGSPSISLMSPKVSCSSIARNNRTFRTKNVSTSPIKIKSFSSTSVPNAVRFGGHGRSCIAKHDVSLLTSEPRFGAYDKMNNQQLIHKKLNYKANTQEPRQSFNQRCRYEKTPRCRTDCKFRTCNRHEGVHSTGLHPRLDKTSSKHENRRERVKTYELNKRNRRPSCSGNQGAHDKYLNRSMPVRTAERIPSISSRDPEIYTNLPVSSSYCMHSIPQLSGKNKNYPALKSRKLHRGCYFRQMDPQLHARNSVGAKRECQQNRNDFSDTHGQFPNDKERELARTPEGEGRSVWFNQDEFDRELSHTFPDEEELMNVDEASVGIQQHDLMNQRASYPDDNNKHTCQQEVIEGGCSDLYDSYPSCLSNGDRSHFSAQSRRAGTAICNRRPIQFSHDCNGYQPTHCQTRCNGINYQPGPNLEQYENRARQPTVSPPQHDQVMYQCTPVQQDIDKTIYRCSPIQPVNDSTMYKITQNQQGHDNLLYRCIPNQQGDDDDVMYQCTPIQPRKDNITNQRTTMQPGNDNIMYERTTMQPGNDNIMYQRTTMQPDDNSMYQRAPMQSGNENIMYQRATMQPDDNSMYQRTPMQSGNENIMYQRTPMQPRNDNIMDQRTPMQPRNDNIIYQRTTMQPDDNSMYQHTPMQPGNDNIMYQSAQIQTNHDNTYHPKMNQDIFYYDQYQPNISHQNYEGTLYQVEPLSTEYDDDALMALPTQQVDTNYTYEAIAGQDYHPTEFLNRGQEYHPTEFLNRGQNYHPTEFLNRESSLETHYNASYNQRRFDPYSHNLTTPSRHSNVSFQTPDNVPFSRNCNKIDCVQSDRNEDMRISSPQPYRRKTQKPSLPTHLLSGHDDQRPKATISKSANKTIGNKINVLDSSVSREITKRHSNLATSVDKQQEHPFQSNTSKSRSSRSRSKDEQSRSSFMEDRSNSVSMNGPFQSISRTVRPQSVSRNRPSQSSRLRRRPSHPESRNSPSRFISANVSSRSNSSGGTSHHISRDVQTRPISSHDSYQSISKLDQLRPSSRNNINRSISGANQSRVTQMNFPTRPISTESKQMPLNWIPSPVPSRMTTLSSHYNGVQSPIARDDSGYETPNVKFALGINENHPNCSSDKRRVTFMDNDMTSHDSKTGNEADNCQAEFQGQEEHHSHVYLTNKSSGILAQQNREIQNDQRCDSPPWFDFSEEGDSYGQVNIETPLSGINDWDKTIIKNVRRRQKVMNNKYVT